MKALVTGATGFIGGNLVRELLECGHRVRALVRERSDRRNLAGLDVDEVVGDLRDPVSLQRALDGCEVLFHVAAAYTLWTPDPKLVYETNVAGTRNLLAAALAKGIERVVYTSTESSIGIRRRGDLGTEESTADFHDLPGAYKKSKGMAEKVALEMHREGLPVVVVNPTTPIGPGDVKPTPTGQIIVDFLNGRMPAYVDAGLNLVDVGDVVKGHILALERGRVGERYILGNRNITFREILGLLGQITGRRAPSLRVPLWMALLAAYVDEMIVSRAMGKPPRVPLAGVRAARKYRYFNCSKSIRELGLPQTPIENALERAVRWFRQNGYAR